MSVTIKSAFAIAATTLLVSLGADNPDAARTENGFPLCNGSPYTGDFIIMPNPSLAPLTADIFNLAAQETIVANVENSRLLTPSDPAVDCDEFMEKIEDTGLVKDISPNYLMTIMPVQP